MSVGSSPTPATTDQLRFLGADRYRHRPDESTVATRVAQTLETGHPRDADNDVLALAA